MAKKPEKIGFEKAINQISSRFNDSQLFDDFMQMTVCAFSLESMEELYLEIAKKYNKEELNGFAVALAEMLEEYQRATFDGSWADVIGDMFEKINSSSQASRSGQFFTPKSLCDIMSQITYIEGEIPENVSDPSCGSSRNLIAHNRITPAHKYVFYHAYDLDKRCVLMSVINFVMHGMRGVVIHMNTLTLQVFGGYRIYSTETGLFVKPMTIAQCKHYLFEAKQKQESKKEIVPAPIIENEFKIINGQLSIF